MQMISANCPACGGSYGGRFTSRYITCEYCGTRFALSKDELDVLGFVDQDGDGFDDNDKAPSHKRRQEDTSSAPMYAFARDACEEFLASGVDRSGFVSSTKIVNGLDIKHGDEVYLIHDDTLFKSGKNGFAISREGIYCREMGDRKSHFVSWEDFAGRGEPSLDDSYIRQNGVSICYYTDNSDVRDDQLYDLFTRMYYHAQQVV